MGKLTKWEAGQELIRAYDAIRDCQVELMEGGHPELAAELTKASNAIAKKFNKLGSHVFELGVFEEKPMSQYDKTTEAKAKLLEEKE